MTATLAQLIDVRSQLAEEVLAYLNKLAASAAELPQYYPPHLQVVEEGKTPFDDIRQVVQIIEDRSIFEKYLAEERERMRAAGEDYDRLAYKPTRARPEFEEDKEREYERDRPAPPPPVPWDEYAGDRFRRAVILGDPGFGKTWLLRYEARRLARIAAQELNQQTKALEDIVLPISVRLSELNSSNDPIEKALVDLAAEQDAQAMGKSAASEDFCQFVRTKLDSDRCVILLDAWDEVPIEIPPDNQPIAYKAHHRQRLEQRLEAFARKFTQPRILLTSRIVGYVGSPIPRAQELELIAFETPQIVSFVSVWFGAGTPKATQFFAQLQRNYQVRGLARIPLMLALMCRAYQEGDLTFPTRRVALYKCCLRGLLRDWKSEKVKCTISDIQLNHTLLRLEQIAFQLDLRSEFTESELAEAAGYDLAKESEAKDAEKFVASLVRDGILITVGEVPRNDDDHTQGDSKRDDKNKKRETRLLFLHRTFQEYLTACSLAARVNLKPDTDVLLTPAKRSQQDRQTKKNWKLIAPFVNEKASNQEWREVIILLSGKLNDPTPLLRLLRNPSHDDFFRHRLCLAAQCLPELARKSRSHFERKIADDAVKLWLKYVVQNIHFQHINRCLRVAIQTNRESIRFLITALHIGIGSVSMRRKAAGALGELGSAAADHPEVVPALLKALHTGDEWVLGNVAEALGQIAPVLSKLWKGFPDRRKDEVRDFAAAALGHLGSVAARHPEVVPALLKALHTICKTHQDVGYELSGLWEWMNNSLLPRIPKLL